MRHLALVVHGHRFVDLDEVLTVDDVEMRMERLRLGERAGRRHQTAVGVGLAGFEDDAPVGSGDEHVQERAPRRIARRELVARLVCDADDELDPVAGATDLAGLDLRGTSKHGLRGAGLRFVLLLRDVRAEPARIARSESDSVTFAPAKPWRRNGFRRGKPSGCFAIASSSSTSSSEIDGMWQSWHSAARSPRVPSVAYAEAAHSRYGVCSGKFGPTFPFASRGRVITVWQLAQRALRET